MYSNISTQVALLAYLQPLPLFYRLSFTLDIIDTIVHSLYTQYPQGEPQLDWMLHPMPFATLSSMSSTDPYADKAPAKMPPKMPLASSKGKQAHPAKASLPLEKSCQHVR